MKKILVPTDFSKYARAAEDTALDIAKIAGAEVHFMHSMFTPIDWASISLKREASFPETKIKIGAAKNELKKLIDRADKIGIKTREFIAYDRGREEIELHLKKYNHDFVIMGSHGEKGMKALLGSNTQKVIRYSKAPVLVVRKNPIRTGIKNIVFASTFEEDILKPFKSVADFADLFNANIHFVYINSPYHFKETDEAENQMTTFIKKSGRKKCTFSIYNALNEERGILKFAESVNASVISLVTHGRNGISRFITPSLTEDIVNHSEIPVLSLNLNVD